MVDYGEFIGNSRAVNLVNNYLETNFPSKVFLFYGQSGLGKKALAKSFAHEILKRTSPDRSRCKLSSGNHPDIHEYYPDSKNGFHSVDAMRGLMQEIVLPPSESKKKIFLIYDIDKTQSVSIQALLKTLEEPSEDSIIVLVTDVIDTIPGTVLSRCLKIPFTPISIKEMVKFIKNRTDLNDDALKYRAKISMGSIEKAVFLETYEGPLLPQLLEQFFLDFESKSVHDLTNFVEEVLSLCFVKDSLYSSEEFFVMSYNFFRDLKFSMFGDYALFPWSQTFKKTYVLDLEELQYLIIETKQSLESFIKPKTVLLNFLLQLQSFILQTQKAK